MVCFNARMANETGNKRNGFIRSTLTIPQELSDFIEAQKNQPAHAGNLSSYVRGLIIADKLAKETTAPQPAAA